MAELCASVSMEEIIGWAAFYDLKNEQEQRAMESAKAGRKLPTR